MPKISVITTTYKHQDYIAQTIESILAQTYTDRELLIGDDSPDDNTREIIQSYVKQCPNKIKARHHSPNKGIVDNMNFLIAKVSENSEYIAFLEGDDLYTPDNLNEKIKIFEEYKNVGLVYNDIAIIDEKNNILYHKYITKFTKNQNIKLDTFINKDIVYCSYSSLMCKKHIIETNPIRTLSIKNNIISDRDFFGRVANTHSIYGIEKTLTHYRRHSRGLTASFEGKEKVLSHLESCVTFFLESHQISLEAYNIFLGRIAILRACNNIFMGNHKEAYKNFCLSMKYGLWIKLYLKLCVALCLLLPVFVCNFLLKILFYIYPNLKKRLLGG